MQKLGIIGYMRAIANFIGKTSTIAELEARKIHHDPTDLFTRAVQPALWLLIYGEVMSRIRAIPTGQLSYIDFIAPGILAQSVIFIAIFYGIAIIWERDMGIVQKFLCTPTPRSALVLGKAVSSAERGLVQAFIVYLLSLVVGVQINWNPVSIFGLVLIVILGSALFSTFSLIIASTVKTRERMMGFGQLITMPLFFASNAIYPISMMPPVLQFISRINPLTYEVDAMRTLMVVNGSSVFGLLFDVAFLLGAMGINLAVATKMYPKVVI